VSSSLGLEVAQTAAEGRDRSPASELLKYAKWAAVAKTPLVEASWRASRKGERVED
jgi:hypothetical protein